MSSRPERAIAIAGLALALAGCRGPAATLVDGACRPEDGGCAPLCPPQAPFGYQVGDTATNLVFPRCDGGQVELHDLCEARVAMVVNVYTWCPSCLANAELASALALEHADRGLESLIVVSEDAYQRPATAALCREIRDYYQLAGIVAYDPDGALATYGTTDLVVLTSPGAIIYFQRRGASEAAITQAVEAGLGLGADRSPAR
jgi:hypothetical protein